MEFNGIQQCSEKTANNATQDQKELAPERIKIQKLSVHKKSLGYQVNSLQGKRKGPHGTRSRKRNLLPRVQCFFSSFPLITVILVNFSFCTRHNIPNSKWIQGYQNGARTIHPVCIPSTLSLAPLTGVFSTSALLPFRIKQFSREGGGRVFYDCSSFPTSIYQVSVILPPVTVTIGGGGGWCMTVSMDSLAVKLTDCFSRRPSFCFQSPHDS